MFFRKRKGFTFIELSVTVLITSLLFAGTSIVFSKIREIAQINETKAKLDEITKALKVYFLENQKLPCPAGLKLTESRMAFGVGSCTQNTSDGIYVSSTLVYGAVPIADLQIAPDFSYDSWDNKFSYIVDTNFTTSSATFASSSGTNAIVMNKLDSDVGDAGDETIANNIIVAIISHGLNGKGAFRETLQNTPLPTNGGTNVYDEYDNIYYDSFDNNFIDDFHTSSYDDVLYYFNKEYFTKSLAIERIGCVEANIPDYTYTANGVEQTISWATSGNCTGGLCDYLAEVQAQSGCVSGDYPDHYLSKNPTSPYYPSRVCLKNGQWSDVIYGCIQGCGDTDGDVSLLTALNGIDPDDNAYVIGDLDGTTTPWMRTGLNEDVILECDTNKVGYVKLTCQSGGSWVAGSPSGNCIDVGDLIP